MAISHRKLFEDVLVQNSLDMQCVNLLNFYSEFLSCSVGLASNSTVASPIHIISFSLLTLLHLYLSIVLLLLSLLSLLLNTQLTEITQLALSSDI